MERKYIILTKAESDNVDFSKVLQTSLNTLRWNKDKTKTFVKYVGDTPAFLSGKTQLSHSEILEELKKDEWNHEND
tara:strand:+ start:248 stop:475 length:228 start_codon:yes stop_codon:yes gene_type:complete